MLPTTGSSPTLQAGTTEARNLYCSEFNRTSAPTVTVLNIVRSKEVTPLEKQHSLRLAHREKVIEHKLIQENLTYKQQFVDGVNFRYIENVKGVSQKNKFTLNNTLLKPFFGYSIPFQFLFPDTDYLQNNKSL